MNNIKNLEINTGYYWTIKILNKNSFIQNALKFANNQILINLINNKLNSLEELLKVNGQNFYEKTNNNIANEIPINEHLYYRLNAENDKYLYSYKVLLNKNYPTNYFLESFDIIIYFDLDTYFVQGGYNWKFNNLWLNKMFNGSKQIDIDSEFINVSTIYLNNLIKNFFLELLSNFSYVDWVNLMNNKKINNLHRLYIYTNEIYSIDDLYSAWINLLYDSLFNKFYSSKNEFKSIAKEMFDFFSLLFLNYFSIANELKVNFYKPNKLIQNKPTNIINKNINDALTSTAKFLNADSLIMFPRKEDYINVVAGLTRDNIFLSKPNVTYNISLNIEDGFFTKEFYKKKKDIYLYSLIALYPEYFDLNYNACNSCNFDEFTTYIKKLYFSDSILREEFKLKLEKNELHDNFNYSSFVRNTNTIIYYADNLDEIEKNTINRNNMAIANVAMGKELNFRLIHTQWHLGLEGISIKSKFLYNQISQEIKDLSVTSNLETKNIIFNDCIKTFNTNFHLKNNVDFLDREVKIKDEFDKRQRFIEIIILGFIVALLIAVIDYFNMVWSDLSCSSSGYGAPLWGATPNPNPISPWNTIWSLPNNGGSSMISRWWSGSSIGFTLFIILINTSILIISLIYLIYARKKNQDIAKRKDVRL